MRYAQIVAMPTAGLVAAGLVAAGLVAAGLLAGCGGEPGSPGEPSSPPSAAPAPTTDAPTTTGPPPGLPLPLPRPQPSTGPVLLDPGLDDRDRAMLAQAHRIGAQWVVLLVATTPERDAEASAQLAGLGGVVGTNRPGPGYLRVTMPTDNVERVSTLPAVTGVDIEEVISPHSPRPTG